MSRLTGVFASLALLTLLLAGGSASGSSVTTRANGRIAFSAVGGIASMNPDGSGQWGVELNVGDTQPTWSPDGAQLAVVTHWAGRAGILGMDPDGSRAHLITTDSSDAEPAWSPDGRRIAFASNGQLLLVNADGGGRVQITHDEGYDSRPAWSPDGSQLAFSAVRENDKGFYNGDVFVLDIASGVERQLTTDSAYDSTPAWSPDGGEIVFASDRDGYSHLYRMDPDGADPQRLTDGPVYDQLPAWSPDGRQISFVRNWQIWTIAGDGSGPRQLTTGAGNTYPAWQPLPAGPPGCTLRGTQANDLLVGSEGREVICGLDGNDTLIGLGGDDVIYGGAGNDWIAGGLGFDLLSGGPGTDRIDARDGGIDRVAGGDDGTDLTLVDRGLDQVHGVRWSRSGRDVAVWRPTTASSFEPTNPPARAADGRIDDWWNSGGYPPAWIEVDLLKPTDIERLRLIAPEQPKEVSYLVLGKGPATGGAYRLLHRFDGPTANLEELAFTSKRPWRGIRYVRVATSGSYGASWVSWPEIEIYPAAKKR
jgi:Ca2+-binding RTX toxin-like protein